VLAGGSLGLADIQPLLEQQPKLGQFYQDHFDISGGGWAPRIGCRRALDGARIAPYSFAAKLKGQPGPYDLWLVIQADTYYFDDQGKPSDMDNGTSYKEALTLIGIRPNALASSPSAHSPK
jgi:hypothetical protein